MNSRYAPTIEISDELVVVHDLVVDDERALSLIRRAGDDAAVPTLMSMIRVGAEGLEAMSDVHHLDFVREQVSGLLLKTERAVDQLADRLVHQADAKFDPARPGSYSHQVSEEVNRARLEMAHALRDAVAQLKADETQLKKELEGSLNPAVQGSATQLAVEAIQGLLVKVESDFDPANKNGHAARLVSELDRYASAGGPFEARLRAELKVARDEISDELRALRDLVVREQTIRATKPIALGDNFEAAVEAALAQVARHADGDWVQNVSRKVGEATDAKAGDFDYHLGVGGIIAIEARNRQGRVNLGGKTGVLEELKKTKANRKADFAIYCVASEDALPDQVGYLQRYDDRIVCCFGSHGEILSLAVKFARLCMLHTRGSCEGADAQAVQSAIEEIQRKVATLSTVKRWCSNITESADKIRVHVGSVTIEVAEIAERTLAALFPKPGGAAE
jgi:hypothetical protein